MKRVLSGLAKAGYIVHLAFLLFSRWPLAEIIADQASQRVRMDPEAPGWLYELWEADWAFLTIVIYALLGIYLPAVLTTFSIVMMDIRVQVDGQAHSIGWQRLLGITLGVFTAIYVLLWFLFV